jgi:hypothetical protein
VAFGGNEKSPAERGFEITTSKEGGAECRVGRDT